MIVHQSDLSAWTRCPQQFFLERNGNKGVQTSALAFGTVMHYVIEVFEREWRTGNVNWAGARLIATDTFRHYWHPLAIDAITAPVELWLPRQTYAGLRRTGVEAIEWYANWAKTEDEELLATEYSFQVPIEGTWDYDLEEPHVLAGTIDRLSFKYFKARPVLTCSDLKTGKDYPYLRQNLQFTSYLMATTRKEFWVGWRGEDGFGDRGEKLHERFKGVARRGEWIALKTHKVMDAGWRGPDDYTRFAVAVEQMVASMKAEIYPLNMTGATCSYCPQRNICVGVGVPSDQHGAPA